MGIISHLAGTLFRRLRPFSYQKVSVLVRLTHLIHRPGSPVDWIQKIRGTQERVHIVVLVSLSSLS